MNIKSRIEKLESRYIPNYEKAWDFTRTSNEQLHRLLKLGKTNQTEFERYCRELIEKGFIKRYEH